MGITSVTAARILEGQRRGESGEENFLFFEKFPHSALSKTYNTNQQTPDSAGTMTAMITGVKTKAGFISVNQKATRGDAESSVGNELLTLLEKAEMAGKSTGVVSTAELTHATPASCYAHVPERGWASDSQLPAGSPVKDIAAQLIDFPKDWRRRGYDLDGLEVAMGGGRSAFFPADEGAGSAFRGTRLDKRNLAAEWVDSRENAAYIQDLDSLKAVDPKKTDHLLGLFSSSHMSYNASRPAGEPSLSDMTSVAIDILDKNRKGFFLMVEGGRVDHGNHAGNAYRSLMDALELAKAVETAYDKVDPEETLIVVTADHSHVITMAGYPTRGNPILGLVVTNDKKGEPSDTFALDSLGKPYTTLGYANGPGYIGQSNQQEEGAKTYPHKPRQYKAGVSGREDLSEKYGVTPQTQTSDAFRDHLQESAIPMGGETHGGEDVGIWATGPQAHLLGGTVEQNVIFHLMDYAFRFKEPKRNPFAEK